MEKTRELPEKSEEMVTISRVEYEALQAKVHAQKQELESKSQELVAALLKNQWLLEQLRLNRKKQYGSSSEQLDQLVFEQFGRVFNEAEAWCAGVGKKETQVKAHTRKPRSGSVEEVVPEGTPVEVVEHRPENRSCPKCNSEMVEIGKEVRRSLKMESARFWIQEDVYYTYACKVCEKETGDSVIVNTPKEPAVLPGSFASPESIAHLMVQKFVVYSPLYRQEQEWGRQGLKLSRQVMSHWLLRAAEDWLAPIYQELHRELLKRDVLHGDETTLQVLKEPGKSAPSKSYMWLYRTGGDAEYPIVLYDYKPDRKAKNAEEFLEGFLGYLHADGYQGYHKLRPDIRVVGCWAHARRKFDEAVNSLPQKEQAGCAALEGQAFCTKLFSIEKDIQGLPFEEKRKQRQNRTKPVLDALFSWAQEKQKVTPPKSALGKALHYPINSMGKSKSLEESVAIAKSRYSGKTKICCTRYGNVMCSRGSVIPLWIDQIKAGNPITVTEPNMTRFIMSLEEAVDLVLYAFEHGENGDLLIMKAPACSIGLQAEAVCEMFVGNKDDIKVIGIRHGEKMYETLLTNEECAKAIDLGDFYRVPADNRGLNYDKYFKDGDSERNTLTEFNSNNTKLLTKEEIKAKMMELAYIRDRLSEE